MSSPPLVSVVMPVFNNSAFIAVAIQSLLRQSYPNIELIVIDDGSTDGSGEIARSSADSRVRVIVHEQNRGLVESRNRGLDEARGEYIAFLDSDDVARPQRIELQVGFLERHADFLGVGGWAQPIDTAGRPRRYVWRLPGDSEYCKAFLLYRQYFNTSAFTARAEVLRALRFRPQHPLAEDYDLYVRASRIGRIANLPKVLVDCRVHGSNTTKVRRQELRACLAMLNRRQLAELGIAATDDQLALHRHVDWLDLQPTDDLIARIEGWLHAILDANARTGIYSEQALRVATAGAWFQVCEHALWFASVPTLRRHFASRLTCPGSVAPERAAKYFAKALLRAVHLGPA